MTSEAFFPNIFQKLHLEPRRLNVPWKCFISYLDTQKIPLIRMNRDQ